MADKSQPPPARLFVLLARNAPVGVILRRGPTEWTQLTHWDTKKDVFTPGQWFHGRVYEYRCDLSPDGSLMIYFAAKHGLRSNPPHSWPVWTAISKPPYFTALDFHPDFDTYGGGGLFVDNYTVLFNNTSPREGIWSEPHPGFKVISRREIYTQEALFCKRLEQGGWVSANSEPYEQGELFTSAKMPCLLQKQVSNYKLSLNFDYKNPQYILSHLKWGKQLSLKKATWADFDRRGRVLVARDGKLFTTTITPQGELLLTELADFNGNQFEPVEAPDWAKQW